MATTTDTTDKFPDKVLTLDVGGRIFRTYKSTILSLPDSFLADILADQNESLLVYTPEGHIFLDRNPDIFASVLHFYRTATWIWPTGISEDAVFQELDFLNILTEVEPSEGYRRSELRAGHRNAPRRSMETIATELVGLLPSVIATSDETKLEIHIPPDGLYTSRFDNTRHRTFLMGLSEALVHHGDSFVAILKNTWGRYRPTAPGLGMRDSSKYTSPQIYTGPAYGPHDFHNVFEIEPAWRQYTNTRRFVREGWMFTLNTILK